mgnify:CR=1 FL=1
MNEKQEKILRSLVELLNTGSKLSLFTLYSAGDANALSKGEVDLLFPYGLFDICKKLWKIHLEEITFIINKESGITVGVKDAIMNSFTLLTPNKKAVINITKFLLLPQNILFVPKLSWKFADAVWGSLEGGDSGFSYYTKRLSLATIYSNCFIYFITSKSHSRLHEVMEKQLSILFKLTKKCS